MWFNNLLVYQYEVAEDFDLNLLLAPEILKPCPPHARFIYGWLPAFRDELVQEIAGALLFCLGKEERILPRGVINRLLAEKVQMMESQQGRKIKRAEKAQLAEDLEFELLPKSFCVQKRLPAFLDTKMKRLMVSTSSSNQASQLTALLRKSIPNLHLEPLSFNQDLAIRFATWLSKPHLVPAHFQLAPDCLLFSLDNEKKRVSCKGYELPSDEILTLISQGLAAAEISLIWNERIQFTLTHELSFKRLKSLDYLIDEFNEIGELEEEYQRLDAALVLVSGELRQLVDDLLFGLNQPSPVAEETAQEEVLM